MNSFCDRTFYCINGSKSVFSI